MRRVVLLVLALCLFPAVGTASVDSSDLIAYYKMNDNAASTAVIDETGKHNGTAQQNTDLISHSSIYKLATALVTFIFDDGRSTDRTVMKPVFDAQGEVACCAIIIDKVGDSGRHSWTRIAELQAAGWEILNHTKTHTDLTTLTEAQIIAEFVDSGAAFDANSIANVNSLVFPNEATNGLVRRIARRFFRSARNGLTSPNPQDLSPYVLCSVWADTHTEGATFQAHVDTADSGALWLIFFLHSTDSNDATTIDGLIDYIQAAGISIVTVNQALDLATYTPCKLNDALDFNGSSDYVAIADHDDFSPGDGSTGTPFSISGWGFMQAATTIPIASKGVAGSDLEWMFMLSGTGHLYVRIQDGSASAYIGRKHNDPLSTHTYRWVHVVATYDGGDSCSGIRLYFDGSRIDDADYKLNTFVAVENDLGHDVWIGRYSTTHYANGLIDNVMFFNKELSQSEVDILYNNGYGTENIVELNEQITPRRVSLSNTPLRRRYGN